MKVIKWVEFNSPAEKRQAISIIKSSTSFDNAAQELSKLEEADMLAISILLNRLFYKYHPELKSEA